MCRRCSAPQLENLTWTAQKVTIKVGSTKRKNVAIYETENTGQLDIKMEQETNLRLTGTIGDKIGVNLKYNKQAGRNAI